MLPTWPTQRHAVSVDRAPGNQVPVLVLDHDVGASLKLLELPLDGGGRGMGHHFPDEARRLGVTPVPARPLSKSPLLDHRSRPVASDPNVYAATTSGAAGPSIMCSFREAKRRWVSEYIPTIPYPAPNRRRNGTAPNCR